MLGAIETLDIVPVPAGSGAGVWQAIIGVVLIIVGIVLAVYDYGALSQFVIGAGISLLLGGVAQMLSPSPKLGSSPNFARSFKNQNELMQQGGDDEGKNKVSYLFSGAANTTSQGNPVKIIYGENIVGSQLISFRITSGTLTDSVIGGTKPPGPSDDFYDLAVWARLVADSRGAAIPDQRTVKGLSVQSIRGIADDFDIPANDPTTGKAIAVGNSKLPRKTLRAYLSAVSHLFSNTPKGISINDARDLYRVLGLNTVTNFTSAPWAQIVYAIALYYSPEP